MSKSGNFYAVAIGKNPGIYSTWDECQSQVKGFSGAKFKKFRTLKEAELFIDPSKNIEGNVTVKITQKTEIKSASVKGDYCVYTDGSCINNGKNNARAGLGVYSEEKHIGRYSEEILDVEKKTNNVAELRAMLKAFEFILNDVVVHNKKVSVFTDSKYVILCLTSYGYKCANKGWSDEIPNRDIVKKLYTMYHNIFPKDLVDINHILAHTGNKDIHSIGNDIADSLANGALT